MPAPSELATRLAEDLLQIGRMLGFEAEKEEPIQEESKYRVDVFWTMGMPRESLFPNINVASIEIQYSYSPTSISHGIFKAEKTLHPAIHVVVSYFKLTEDYVNNVLKTHYPRSGLLIIDGEEKVRKLNLWITRFITNKDEERILAEKGKKIKDFAVSQLPNADQSEIKDKIRENFQPEIEEILIPPEITSLIDTFAKTEAKGYDRSIFDEVFANFIGFIQSKMVKYNIPKFLVPVETLFPSLEEKGRYIEEIRIAPQIEIRRDNLVVMGGDNEFIINIEKGNVSMHFYDGSDYKYTLHEEALASEQFITFLRETSKVIISQIHQYDISNVEKKLLEEVKEALES